MAKLIECLEEITLAYTRCKKETNCAKCVSHGACIEVFGKDCPNEVIEELAAQCRAFNDFARANRKEK